ncbi:hypothetical protein CAEBREN_01581 [Caenorhabditis brenneri]|uniref:Uncharacterized protein n=1 Tax=Caenorhabditis brenneri TaxID=135651 RepID=G0P8P2_CAEBE|nr:hypothetical protein CAEBREN_01581 [Caenorhabditis brenneri]
MSIYPYMTYDEVYGNKFVRPDYVGDHDVTGKALMYVALELMMFFIMWCFTYERIVFGLALLISCGLALISIWSFYVSFWSQVVAGFAMAILMIVSVCIELFEPEYSFFKVAFPGAGPEGIQFLIGYSIFLAFWWTYRAWLSLKAAFCIAFHRAYKRNWDEGIKERKEEEARIAAERERAPADRDVEAAEEIVELQDI